MPSWAGLGWLDWAGLAGLGWLGWAGDPDPAGDQASTSTAQPGATGVEDRCQGISPVH